MDTGESAKETVKPLRREGRREPAYLWWTYSYAFFICMRGCGCNGHPAFPAPSVRLRDCRFEQSGRDARRGNMESCADPHPAHRSASLTMCHPPRKGEGPSSASGLSDPSPTKCGEGRRAQKRSCASSEPGWGRLRLLLTRRDRIRSALLRLGELLREKIRKHLDACGPGSSRRRHQMHRALGLLPSFQNDLDVSGGDGLADDELRQIGDA